MMDAAISLVESFMRLNGYLTVSEWQVVGRNERGEWDTVTDIDLLAVRFPHDSLIADSHLPEDREALIVTSDLLSTDDQAIDVVIGEIKQGDAVFNTAMSRHEPIHMALSRLAWLYPGEVMDNVVADLATRGVCRSESPGGAPVRTRLVAFGRADRAGLNTIPIGALIAELTALLDSKSEILKSARFSTEALTTLKLMVRAGFDLSRDLSDPRGSD